MNSEKRVKFKTGSQVQWKWMGRTVLGTVRKAFPTPITLEIKGKSITRKGSDENPAYLVESEAGNQALKLATELETRDAKSNKSTKSQPSLFKGTAGKSTRESN